MGTRVTVSTGLSKPGHLLSILQTHLYVVGGEDAHAAVVLALQPVPVHLLVDVDDVPLLQRQLPGGTPTCPQPHRTSWVPIHHPGDRGDTVGTPSITVTYLGDSAWKSNLRRAAFIWGGRGAVMGGYGGTPHIPDPPSRPHLLLLPPDGLRGVPHVGQAGEGPWPEGVCKEGASLGGRRGCRGWHGLGGAHLCQGPPGSARWPAPAPPAPCRGWRVGGGCRGGSAAGGATGASCGVTVAQPSPAATLPPALPAPNPAAPRVPGTGTPGTPGCAPPGLSRPQPGGTGPKFPGTSRLPRSRKREKASTEGGAWLMDNPAAGGA